MAFTMSREEFRGDTKLLLTIRDLEPQTVETALAVAD